MAKILIVEDEESLRNLYQIAFAKNGFEVFTASDGKEGLEEVSKHNPDFILLDLVMPNMGGLAMLEKLRENEQAAKIPVIILSNMDDTDKVAKALELGAEDYIPKASVETKEIVKRVKEKLNII